MERCFVIQPFDGASFDARYDSVLVPALQAAELEAYRVDRDQNVTIPIQDIEAQIRGARICLADISLDNPNVWFELGYAIAAFKDVILICSEVRQTRYPFDVQHRNIIKYGTGSPQDFDNLRSKITERAIALMRKEVAINAAADISKLAKIQGLEQHEVVGLATIAENLGSLDGFVAMYQIKRDMERSGFTPLAATLAMRALTEHGLLEQNDFWDEEGDKHTGYKMTSDGWAWVMANKNAFTLTRDPRRQTFDDNLPF